jgi:hypothetical protein
MKTLIPSYISVAIFLLSSPLSHSGQNHKGLASLEVLEAATQNTLGYNAGYYVEFINHSQKSIDGVKWKVDFLDNFGTIKGKREGQWQSGNFTKPVAPGNTMKDIEGVWVEGATKVIVTIKEVHFTDGTSKRAKK